MEIFPCLEARGEGEITRSCGREMIDSERKAGGMGRQKNREGSEGDGRGGEGTDKLF